MIIPSFDVKGDVRIRVHHFTPNAPHDQRVLVLCHPTGFCASVYSSVVSHLRGVNVFGIDIRSHGYSQRGDVTDWAGFQHDLDSACAEIQRRTGHDTFVGVGISSGSSAHILNASRHKDLYDGLYLAEPILFPPGADLAGRDALASSARKRRDTFESYNDAYSRYRQGGGLSHLSESALALYCVHGFEHDGDVVRLRCRPEDEEAIYLSGGANGVYEALKDVTCPSVIVYGEMSKTISAESAHAIAHQMRNARVERLDGTGHFTLFENPFAGAASITSFVNSLDR